MAHQRNVEGLRQSARKRHVQTLARADAALRQLVKEGRAITFPNVAETAGVSVSWLYKQSEIKQRIQDLRAQQRQNMAGIIQEGKEKTLAAAKDAVIATLKQQIKDLRAENRELRKQIEVAYGQLRQEQRPNHRF